MTNVLILGANGQLGRHCDAQGAASLELTADDLRAIDEAASRIRVEGARYPEELEKRTGL